MCLVDANVNVSKVQIEHEDNATKKFKYTNCFNVEDAIVPLCESNIEKIVNNYEDVPTEGRII